LKNTWKKIATYVLEIGKWVLVIWLLLPMRDVLSGPVDFTRIALGILLFILFSGKMFYDAIIDNYKKRDVQSAGAEILSTLITVIIMAAMVAFVVGSVGLLLYAYVQQANEPSQ